MTVYVRWYGKVLEGELLEGESMGMKQVRILLDGHHPVALFTPEHVYDSADKISASAPKITEKPREISRSESFDYCQERINQALLEADPLDFVAVEVPEPAMNMLRFKKEHWDHERNHLRTDSLDQFYKLWCEAMTPFGHVEQGGRKMDSDEITARPQRDYGSQPMSRNAVKQSPQRIVSDERMAELRTQLKKSLKPVEVKQLSLFD